jgi:small subunit ribosomal protein S21
MSVEVKLRKGETVDKALRRLKKKLDREDILRGIRARRYFEKPCEKRRRREKVAKFNNMLRLRYENA